MTQITRDEVQKLASLSSLQLADDEIESLQADIGAILDYVQQLDELDTNGISPAYQVTGLKNVMRDDIVDAGEVGRDQLLALAPDILSNQIKVPKVL
jgi:aspartyl-tRNA(Asn)/glutamyl-tRNA(Gln) amidotransferase subunit C